MPELPEVETMVRGLRPHLVGRKIIATEFCKCDKKPICVTPERATFQQQTRDAAIEGVQRLAKRITISLDQAHHLVIEPRMTGLLLVSAPPTQDHRRICWTLNEVPGQPPSFEFWDRRGLGTVALLNQNAMNALKDRLGPDPLNMSMEQWTTQLSKSRSPIKNALLNQKLVVGIGNIYASEILHRAGISPAISAASLSGNRIIRLAEASQEILHDAIRYEGSTLGDGTYRNALNRQGNYQNKHCVYQKEGAICPTCHSGRIRRIVQAQRSTFYCPRCQRR